MTIEEYAKAQAAISAALIRQILAITADYRSPKLTNSLWLQLLGVLFPVVKRFRKRSAVLAREFYDSQRKIHYPDLPTHPIFLAEYEFEWFVNAMQPSKADFLRSGTSEDAESRLALRTMKEVENGGRKTLIRPVEDPDEDIQDEVVKGWARVATGRETCEFCLMLVSRGPVYSSAKSAGLNTDDETAREVLHTGTDAEIKELMNRWHEGCDCKVVPVFNKANWPGRDAFKKAQEVWRKYSKMVDNNSDLRTPQNGNQRGPNDRKWSRSEATLAAIRRAFYNGELDGRSYSIAA
jgi:hypothetical protein